MHNGLTSGFTVYFLDLGTTVLFSLSLTFLKLIRPFTLGASLSAATPPHLSSIASWILCAMAAHRPPYSFLVLETHGTLHRYK